MRILCTGSRDWDRPDVVDGALDIIAKAAAADLVLVFHRAGSPGTAHCVEAAEKAELITKVVDYDDIPDAAEVSS